MPTHRALLNRSSAALMTILNHMLMLLPIMALFAAGPGVSGEPVFAATAKAPGAKWGARDAGEMRVVTYALCPGRVSMTTLSGSAETCGVRMAAAHPMLAVAVGEVGGLQQQQQQRCSPIALKNRLMQTGPPPPLAVLADPGSLVGAGKIGGLQQRRCKPLALRNRPTQAGHPIRLPVHQCWHVAQKEWSMQGVLHDTGLVHGTWHEILFA